MLRAEAIQEWAQLCQKDPRQCQVQRARRDPGDEGAHPELPGEEGGGVRHGTEGVKERPQVSRLLARVWPSAKK